MLATTWASALTQSWEAQLTSQTAVALPMDLWSTLTAASRLLHLDIGGLYTQPTGLISFPGTALILVPVAALCQAAGFGLAPPDAAVPHPQAWLLAGPYEMALSGLALLAADAIAERLGAARPKRALLAVAGAIALGSVSLAGGHPEDAVAVGLFLYGFLALADARGYRSAWLFGAAVAVQPLVLLALPVAAMAVERRRLPGYAARVAAPAALLLAIAFAANRTATFAAVVDQPNWPSVDHITPWISLTRQMSGGAVSAGPGRVLAIVVACGCAVAARRLLAAAGRPARWSPALLEDLLWWAAAALAVRCAFEPVMVAYYVWPPLAVSLAVAARQWPRLVPAALTAVIVTVVSGAGWRGPWAWWGAMVAGLCLTLLAARPRRRNRVLFGTGPGRAGRTRGRCSRDRGRPGARLIWSSGRVASWGTRPRPSVHLPSAIGGAIADEKRTVRRRLSRFFHGTAMPSGLTRLMTARRFGGFATLRAR
jgi:hypothetical protein